MIGRGRGIKTLSCMHFGTREEVIGDAFMGYAYLDLHPRQTLEKIIHTLATTTWIQ